MQNSISAMAADALAVTNMNFGCDCYLFLSLNWKLNKPPLFLVSAMADSWSNKVK